jgi:excisionase family DNA binding protein
MAVQRQEKAAPSPLASPIKLLLTPAEAAQALSIDRSTLYAYLMSGAIRSFQIGRARRISVRALNEWIARQEGRSPDGHEGGVA